LRIPNIWTGSRKHVAKSSDGMTTPMLIPGTLLYVEANQSSTSVLKVIKQIIIALGEDENIFKVDW